MIKLDKKKILDAPEVPAEPTLPPEEEPEETLKGIQDEPAPDRDDS